MDFYERVKLRAKDIKKQTVQQFVISLGMNHDSYYSLKRVGNLPRADEAVMIADELETTVEFLVNGDEEFVKLSEDETEVLRIYRILNGKEKEVFIKNAKGILDLHEVSFGKTAVDNNVAQKATV